MDQSHCNQSIKVNHISFTRPFKKVTYLLHILRSMIDFYSNLKWKLVQIHRWLFGYGELASSGLGHFVLTLFHFEKKAYWSLGRLRIAIKWVYWIILGMTWFFAGCIKRHKHPILLSLSYSFGGAASQVLFVCLFLFFLIFNFSNLPFWLAHHHNKTKKKNPWKVGGSPLLFPCLKGRTLGKGYGGVENTLEEHHGDPLRIWGTSLGTYGNRIITWWKHKNIFLNPSSHTPPPEMNPLSVCSPYCLHAYSILRHGCHHLFSLN